MKLHTIGFTQSTAESFFTRLKKAGVKRVLDVRLLNDSQLAGFARRDHLAYFLKAICGIEYEHRTDLAPTQELLESYHGKKQAWPEYEKRLQQLFARRKIESALPKAIADGACLLCSEVKPHQCHRRIVAEHLQKKWGKIEILHL